MFENKKESIIGIIATIGMMGALVAYVWIVMYTIDKKTNAEIKESKNNAEMLLLDTTHQQKIFLRSIEDTIKEMNTYILQKEKVAIFLREIEMLGAYTGTEIHIEDIAVEDIANTKKKTSRKVESREQEKKKNVLSNLIITITTKGSSDGVYTLLSLLETLPTASVIENVSLVKQEDGVVWSAKFRLRVLQSNKEVL